MKTAQVNGEKIVIRILNRNSYKVGKEKLGLSKAMAMDGGASTSVNYKNIEIFSSNNNERKVKSFLVIEN